jgi:aryl-alcohol dehydrogenase-like predicted oxidoreductase
MLTRRDALRLAITAGATTVLPAGVLAAFDSAQLITRAIPKSGEKLPAVGLGSSATFRRVAQTEDVAALAEVMQVLVENGGTVFDTAPSYGASEEVSGQIADDAGMTDKLFWATKVNALGRGEPGPADPQKVTAQLERSFERAHKDPIDLIQVHNLADLPNQMGAIQELKQEGRIRYIGTTATNPSRDSDLEQAMKDYPIDFIGVDYAVDNRRAAERILPLAQDLGIATLIYVPFGRTRLFARTSGLDVPEWAQEFGAATWAQFFIKYVVAHPATTCVTPATSKAKHMLDNIAAAYGDLPDAATLRKMEELIDALPSA